VATAAPLASLVIDAISDAVGMTLVLTGLVAGAFRSLAVLGGASSDRVEWFMAVGFVGGCIFAAFVLLLDAIVR
jgi:hypothetical protein